MSTNKESTPTEREERLNQILADYLEAAEKSAPIDRDALIAAHPDLQSELQDFFSNENIVSRRTMADHFKTSAAPVDATAGMDALIPVPAPGERLRYFGDYELIEELARGGMGVVFKARQVSLNRTVALKMILAGQLASKDDVERFRREAEAAANLDHPNIVPIHEVGEHGGLHYFSMKLIEGGSLAQRIADARFTKLDATPADARGRQREIADLMATIARAVHHAHQRGILHRDLKPANILIDSDGKAVVTDFGLAKRVESGTTVTHTGAVVGTPSYMAPEQASGRKGVVSTLSDVYSLGAILYHFLTGQPPFSADNPIDTLLAVMSEEPAPPRRFNSKLDADLEAVCLKCLAKDPKQRYPSAEALAEDLETWLAGEPTRARPRRAPMVVWLWLRRNIGAVVWILMVGLLGGGIVSFALAASASHILFQKALETYAKYPSLEPPTVLRIGESVTGLITGNPALFVPIGLCGLVAMAFGGLGAVLLVRTRNAWGDCAAGLATGTIAGLSALALGAGTGVVLGLVVVPSIPDLQLFGNATILPDNKMPGHPSDVLVERYPDLRDVEPNARGNLFFPKIVADMVAGSFLAIWLAVFWTIISGVFFVLPQTIAAGYLLRSRERWRDIIIPYFELWLPAVLLLFSLPIAAWMRMVAPAETEPARDSFWPLAMIALLGGLSLVGVTRGWTWYFRFVVYSAWFSTLALLGQNAWSRLDWWLWIAPTVVGWIGIPVLLVHYYERSRRLAPLSAT